MKNQKQFRKVLSTVLMMLVGAAIGFLGARTGLNWASSMPKSYVIVLIASFVPLFFFVVAAHEAGHAIAGWLVGFDFRMYVVGPFMWEKEESGWKFKWNKNVNLSGGLVICLPTSTENLAKRFSRYALGGPAASLVFAGVAFFSSRLLLSAAHNSDSAVYVAGALFGLMAILSAVVFAITIVPLHTSGFYSDGARAIRFLRGGDTARFETLLMKIVTTSSAGIRPRLLNVNEIQEALAIGERIHAPMSLYLHFYLYQHAFDRGNFDEAETSLRNYLDRIEDIPKGMRGMAYLDAAFFYGFARQDVGRAESYFNQYEPSAIIPKAMVLAAEAAIKLHRDPGQLDNKITQALKTIPSMMDKGVAIVLADKLRTMNAAASVPV